MNISGTHVEFGLCEYSNEFSDSHVEKWLLDLCWVSNIIHFLLTLQRNMVPWAQWKTMSTVLISKENDSLTAILIGKYKKKKKKEPFLRKQKFPKLLWSSIEFQKRMVPLFSSRFWFPGELYGEVCAFDCMVLGNHDGKLPFRGWPTESALSHTRVVADLFHVMDKNKFISSLLSHNQNPDYRNTTGTPIFFLTLVLFVTLNF